MPRTCHRARWAGRNLALLLTLPLLLLPLCAGRAAAEPSIAVVPVRLIKAPEALRAEPVVVRRLQRQRQARRAAISSRTA